MAGTTDQTLEAVGPRLKHLRLRRDVTRLITDAAGRQQPVYVLVNNKAEGSAPLTIRALAERLVAELEHDPSASTS